MFSLIENRLRVNDLFKNELISYIINSGKKKMRDKWAKKRMRRRQRKRRKMRK